MTRLFLVALLVAGGVGASGCTGGCWDAAGAVTTDPATPCLMLYGGQSPTDATVCGVPELSGQNGCTDALTLPPRGVGGEPTVIQPGDAFHFAFGGAVPPGITVVSRGGGATDYVILAMLGTEAITMTIPVHHD